MTSAATTEGTGVKVKHTVFQAYIVDTQVIGFMPEKRVPGKRYRILYNGVAQREWTDRKPSAKVAVFFYEKIVNGRYVQ